MSFCNLRPELVLSPIIVNIYYERVPNHKRVPNYKYVLNNNSYTNNTSLSPKTWLWLF